MVYITSAFRGDDKANLNQAVEYYIIASGFGMIPVIPHVMPEAMHSDADPGDGEKEVLFRMELLNRSSELWVMGKLCSAMMKREIYYAREQNIPTYYIPEPHKPESYPVSADNHPLLCQNNCEQQGMEGDITGKTVVLPHHLLKPEYRSPINQLWVVTHGPGCRPDSFTGTVHIRHPIDGDRMAVHRHELCGVATMETMKQMLHLYPESGDWLPGQREADEVPER